MPDIVVDSIRPKRPDFSAPSPVPMKIPQQVSQPVPLTDGKPPVPKPPKIKRENSFDKKPVAAQKTVNPPKSPAPQKSNFHLISFNYFEIMLSMVALLY